MQGRSLKFVRVLMSECQSVHEIHHQTPISKEVADKTHFLMLAWAWSSSKAQTTPGQNCCITLCLTSLQGGRLSWAKKSDTKVATCEIIVHRFEQRAKTFKWCLVQWTTSLCKISWDCIRPDSRSTFRINRMWGCYRSWAAARRCLLAGVDDVSANASCACKNSPALFQHFPSKASSLWQTASIHNPGEQAIDDLPILWAPTKFQSVHSRAIGDMHLSCESDHACWESSKIAKRSLQNRQERPVFASLCHPFHSWEIQQGMPSAHLLSQIPFLQQAF